MRICARLVGVAGCAMVATAVAASDGAISRVAGALTAPDGAPGFERFRLSAGDGSSGASLELIAAGATCRYALQRFESNPLAPARTVEFAGTRVECDLSRGERVRGYVNVDAPEAPGFVQLFEGKKRLEYVVKAATAE